MVLQWRNPHTWVRSNGKPYVSHKTNASYNQETTAWEIAHRPIEKQLGNNIFKYSLSTYTCKNLNYGENSRCE